MSWVTTTSAAANAASVAAWSPASQSKMWLSALPGRSSRITGAPGSSARSASTTGGSGSYSTSISSSASRAEYRSSATTNATSWPWKRTLSVASTACTSLGQGRHPGQVQRSARVSPVITASTLGWASRGRGVDRRRSGRARSGLRRIAPYSMPGSWMSSTNVAPAADEPRVLLARHRPVRRRVGSVALMRRHRGRPMRSPSPSPAAVLARPTGPTGRCSRSRCTGRSARRWPRGSAPADGSGWWSSSQRAVIIMPGVQKPHCSPWHAAKPSCTGSSWPRRSRPSTVRTRCPSAMAASTVQDFTGISSSQTTQAPQFEVSQPQCEPVSRSSSRRKWISSSRGSTSRVYVVAVDGHVICIVRRPRCPRAARARAAQRAHGQLGGQVPLVVGRPALVGRRAGSARRRSRPARAKFSSVAGAPRRNSSASAPRSARAPTAVEPDAGVGDRVTVAARAPPRPRRPASRRPGAPPSRRRCRRRAGSGSGSR